MTRASLKRNKTAVCLTIDDDIIEAIDYLAKAEDRSRSGMISIILKKVITEWGLAKGSSNKKR